MSEPLRERIAEAGLEGGAHIHFRGRLPWVGIGDELPRHSEERTEKPR